jgi:hypothetical protein
MPREWLIPTRRTMARLAPDGKGNVHYEIAFDDECQQHLSSHGEKVTLGIDRDLTGKLLGLAIRPDDDGLYKLKMKNGKKIVSVPIKAIKGDSAISNEAGLRQWHEVASRIEDEIVEVKIDNVIILISDT